VKTDRKMFGSIFFHEDRSLNDLKVGQRSKWLELLRAASKKERV
jgi:hypothetical protein